MVLRVIPVIQPDSVRSFLKRLNRAESQFHDRTTVNRQVGVAIYSQTLRNFDQQGRLFTRWAPLSPSTVKQKRKLGKSVPLVRSGNLRAGFSYEATRENVRLGNEVSYSKFHNEGSPGAGIPKRQLLPSREQFLKVAVRIYEDYANRVTREANA